MNASCESCRFYKDDGDAGECRRHAPAVHAFWPVVHPHNWCGEYESNRAITATIELDDYAAGSSYTDDAVIELSDARDYRGRIVEVTIREIND